MLPHHAQDKAFVTAFINEAKVSASLSHGNIAQVFDFGVVDGDYFIAMELVDGRSLAQMLDRAATKGFSRLPIPIACFLTIEVLRACTTPTPDWARMAGQWAWSTATSAQRT